ncbi:MAG: D-alanine--D-alanine ligase [Candidatus Paceibacterota bacterium]
MHKIRVGVIRGGVSNEYSVSIKTGAAIINNLPEKYEAVDIFIDKSGVWHCAGVVQHPADIFSHIDLVINALHGYYGEDGKIQALFEKYAIPYVGSDSFGSALAMNKVLAKEVFKKEGLRSPYYAYIEESEDVLSRAKELYRHMPQPTVVKPASGGSSFGVIIAKTFNEFLEGIENALAEDTMVLIEECKKGKEISCGLVERFRGEEHYVFPPIEIITPKGSAFFDYEAKYNGISQELCPAPSLSKEEKTEIMEMTRKAHKALSLRHYSRADFILTPQGAYLLEVNTLPGLTEESLLPKAVEAVGSSFQEFLEHLIALALQKK